MTEQTTDPALDVWNPLERTAPEVIPLKASGGRASVTYRTWTGAERLAYEDSMTVRFMVRKQNGEVEAVDSASIMGDQTIRMGSMRAYAAALTIVGSQGFPQREGHDMFSGDVDERLADLMSVADSDTYSELVRTANRVQPLPSANDAANAETDGDGGDPVDPPAPGSSASPTETTTPAPAQLDAGTSASQPG